MKELKVPIKLSRAWVVLPVTEKPGSSKSEDSWVTYISNLRVLGREALGCRGRGRALPWAPHSPRGSEIGDSRLLPSPAPFARFVYWSCVGRIRFLFYLQTQVFALSPLLPGRVGVLDSISLGAMSSEGQGERSKTAPVTMDSSLLIKGSRKPSLAYARLTFDVFTLWFFFIYNLLMILGCCAVLCSVVSNSSYPMDCSTPGFPVLHCLLEFAQVHIHLGLDVAKGFG